MNQNEETSLISKSKSELIAENEALYEETRLKTEALRIAYKRIELIKAISSDKVNTVKKFFEEGLRLEAKELSQGLFDAVRLKNKEMLDLLGSYGANFHVTLEEPQNWTLLHEISSRNILYSEENTDAIEILQYLLARGIDPNIRVFNGKTCLSKYVNLYVKEGVIVLLNAGATVDEDLKNEIENLLKQDDLKLLKIGEYNDHPIYRKADKQGKPVKTYQELYNQKASVLVANSLFKTTPAVSDVMSEQKITTYLDKNDVATSLCVSKVEENGDIEKNSIKNLEKEVVEKTTNSFSFSG